MCAKGLKSRLKAFVKKALRKINHELLLRPELRQRVLRWSCKLGVYAKLKSLLAKAQFQPQSVFALPQSFKNLPAEFQNLSPRAQQIYIDLKKAIVQQREDNH